MGPRVTHGTIHARRALRDLDRLEAAAMRPARRAAALVRGAATRSLLRPSPDRFDLSELAKRRLLPALSRAMALAHLVGRRRSLLMARQEGGVGLAWDESLHPRNEDGEFAESSLRERAKGLAVQERGFVKDSVVKEVLYHGTPNDFQEFPDKVGKIGWFTTDYDYARQNAGATGRVIAVLLKITKPLSPGEGLSRDEIIEAGYDGMQQEKGVWTPFLSNKQVKILAEERVGVSLSWALGDVYTDVKAVLRKTLKLKVGDLEEKYGRAAARSLRDAVEKIDAKVKGSLLEIGMAPESRTKALKLLSDSLEDAGVGATGASQLETVFRTALYQAAAIGRYEADQELGDEIWGYRYVTMRDDAVREEHAALDGVTLPKDDPFWLSYWPPNGWNCLRHDTLITTSVGAKQIIDVKKGDLVLTHRGRFKRVVGWHRNKGPVELVSVKVEDVSTPTFLTANHCVLTKRGWVEAGRLEHDDQVACPFDGVLQHDPCFDVDDGGCRSQERVPGRVNGAFLQLDEQAETREIDPIRPDVFVELVSDAQRFKDFAEELLTAGHRSLSVWVTQRVEDLVSAFRFGQRFSRRVVEGFTSDGQRYVLGPLWVQRMCYDLGFSLGPQFYAVTYENLAKRPERNAGLIRDRFQRATSLGVVVEHACESSGPQRVDEQLGVGVESLGPVRLSAHENVRWKKIDTLAIVPVIDEFVYNLSVEDDESYVANGIAVHNCRCMVVPLFTERKVVRAKALPTLTPEFDSSPADWHDELDLSLAWDEDEHPRDDDGQFANKHLTYSLDLPPGDESIEDLTGYDEQEIALMCGALDGAHVAINVADNGHVVVNVEHDDYTATRFFDRGGDTLYNDFLRVKYSAQKRGMGTEIFKQQVDHAIENGFKRIKTNAGGNPKLQSGMIGYYTWPRLGYDAAIGAAVFPMRVLDYARAHGLKRTSDFMRDAEHRKWWRDNGVEHDAEFDLREGSLSRRVLDAYVDAKQEVSAAWSEEDHPREDSGTTEGGRFASKKGEVVIRKGGTYKFGQRLEVSDAEFAEILASFGVNEGNAHDVVGAPPDAKVEVLVKSGKLIIDARGEDENAGAYHMTRLFLLDGKYKSCVNVLFTCDKPKTGLGIRVFGAQVKKLGELGFKEITTEAVRDDEMNGYYTWPRFGYDTRIAANSHRESMNHVLTYAKEHGLEKISDFMRDPGHREWWMKNGESIELLFDLREGSQSRRVLDAYVEAKGIKLSHLSHIGEDNERQTDRATAGAGRGGRGDLGRGVERFGLAFDPNQARDTVGRWTETGGGLTTLKERVAAEFKRRFKDERGYVKHKMKEGLSEKAARRELPKSMARLETLMKDSVIGRSFKNGKTWSDALSDVDAKLVGEWIGNENEYYRELDMKCARPQDVVHLIGVFSAAPKYEGVAYRGLRVEERDVKKWFKVGRRVGVKGMQSFSKAKGTAHEFGHESFFDDDSEVGVVLVAYVKDARDISSVNKTEREVIVRNENFKIKSVKKQGGRYYVELR
jgi:hypothetical protein